MLYYFQYLKLSDFFFTQTLCSSASTCLMDPRGLRMNQSKYFSLWTHSKQLLLLTFCKSTAGIGSLKVWRDADAVRTDRCEGWNSYVDLMWDNRIIRQDLTTGRKTAKLEQDKYENEVNNTFLDDLKYLCSQKFFIGIIM